MPFIMMFSKIYLSFSLISRAYPPLVSAAPSTMKNSSEASANLAPRIWSSISSDFLTPNHTSSPLFKIILASSHSSPKLTPQKISSLESMIHTKSYLVIN